MIKELPPNVKLEKERIENETDCIENQVFKAVDRLEKKMDDNFMDMDTEEFEFESLELHQTQEDSCSSSLKNNKIVKDETSSIYLAVYNPSNKDDIENTVYKKEVYTKGKNDKVFGGKIHTTISVYQIEFIYVIACEGK